MSQEMDREFQWQSRLKREYAEFVASHERAFESIRYIKHVCVRPTYSIRKAQILSPNDRFH